MSVPNLTCPDENQLAKLKYESKLNITFDKIDLFFQNFDMSIWASKLEINLSRIKIYWLRMSR